MGIDKPKCTICKINDAQRNKGKSGTTRCQPCNVEYMKKLNQIHRERAAKRGDYIPRKRSEKKSTETDISDTTVSGQWLRKKLVMLDRLSTVNRQ